MSAPDLDAFLIPDLNVHDGVLGLIGIDDDRPMAAWSHYHAQRCVTQLAIAQARVRVAEGTLADVSARGDARCIARAEQWLAQVRAELAGWQAQRDRLERARRADPYAPRESPFAAAAISEVPVTLTAEYWSVSVQVRW